MRPVIPLDILPYYFALEPSPTDARSSFALTRLTPGQDEASVSIILEDQRQCSEIFRFTRLGFVKIAWSACGKFLAFAQHSNLMLRDPSGALRLISLPGDIQWLGFDRDGRLWSIADGRLEARIDSSTSTLTELVDGAVVADFAAYCRQEQSGLSIYVHDGNHHRQLACLADSTEYTAVRLSLRGNYLIVVLASSSVDNRAQVRIVRFDLTTSGMETLLDEQLAFGFNAGPGIAAVTLRTGEVLAAFEKGACTRVWDLAPRMSPKAISPEGFEVFDFVLDSSEKEIAIIASDTHTPLGAAQRQLLFGRREGKQWAFSTPVAGIYDMPRWRMDGRLEVLCGDEGTWRKQVCDPNETGVVAPADWCTANHVSTEMVEYDFVRLPGPQHRQAAIILLPRIHQQFVAGAQSFFFHHLLFSIARGLALDGYTVVIPNGPGAIGRGHLRREPPGSYFGQLRSAIFDLANSLRAEGCKALGIFGGSLAAVPALRLLGPGTPFSACACVAPLFESSIPVTVPLKHHLVDDPAIESFGTAARNMQVPMLVIHGSSDEVAPLWQVTKLCKHVSDPALIELCILEEEGHIFKKPHSWERARMKIEVFFDSHLALS